MPRSRAGDVAYYRRIQTFYLQARAAGGNIRQARKIRTERAMSEFLHTPPDVPTERTNGATHPGMRFSYYYYVGLRKRVNGKQRPGLEFVTVADHQSLTRQQIIDRVLELEFKNRAHYGESEVTSVVITNAEVVYYEAQS